MGECEECGGPKSAAREALGLAVCSGPCNDRRRRRLALAAAVEARATAVYPEDVFTAPTSEDYAEINALLKRERGHQLDGIAGDIYRRAHASIAGDIREGRIFDYLRDDHQTTAPTPTEPPSGGDGGAAT